MTEENDFHFAEFAKPVAKHGKNRRLRTLLVLLYVFAGIAYAAIAVAITIPHLIAILPLLLWILIYFTWGLVSYECCVRVASGKIAFLKLRGKKEKTVVTFALKEIVYARPYTPNAPQASGVRMRDLRADEREAGYILLHKTETGEELIRFEATLAVVNAMHYYNKNVIIDKDVLKI